MNSYSCIYSFKQHYSKILKNIYFLLFLSPYLLAIQCFDEECNTLENWELNTYAPLISISPLQESFDVGDTITLRVTVPNSNEYFGEMINLLESTGDETGLVQLISWEGKADFFLDNNVVFRKGSQGNNPTSFVAPYNSETGNYEFEAEITLNRTGNYTMLADGSVEFGTSDCPEYLLNMKYIGVESQSIEFVVHK